MVLPLFHVNRKSDSPPAEFSLTLSTTLFVCALHKWIDFVKMVRLQQKTTPETYYEKQLLGFILNQLFV